MINQKLKVLQNRSLLLFQTGKARGIKSNWNRVLRHATRVLRDFNVATRQQMALVGVT